MARVIDSGLAKHGASGLMSESNEVVRADSTNSATLLGASLHSLRQRSKIHKPQMFFKKRIVLSMPPSLVKFCLKLSSLMIGFGDSMPRSDHVPQLKYAKSLLSDGMATTAEAVSCPATATTGTAPKPV